MLSHLHIRELATIEEVEIAFQPGMTVLTGETGAGKSILIDAIGLVLGDRADSDLIRNGGPRAEVCAVFQVDHLPTVQQWLADHALDENDACILRRVVMRDGPSRAFVNGSPVPARSLQALGDQLMEIHGQHAHHALLKADRQRQLLDEYAGLQLPLQQLAELYRQWRATEQQAQALARAEQERYERSELLRFQVDELTALQLKSEELAELDRDQRRLSHAQLLLQRCAGLQQLLDEDEQSVGSRLARAGVDLAELAAIDPALDEQRELLESAAIQLQEAVAGLRDYAATIELDPQRLAQIEQRLVEIHDLARKYRCKAGELPGHLQALQAEASQLQQQSDQLETLQQQIDQLAERYQQLAEHLGQQRRAAAQRLEAAISEGSRALGMAEAQVQIAFEALPLERATIHGLDQLEILISTNPGQPLRPLAKVASGGELSRLSLAIQVATIRCAQVPTLIFDEVDVGIGGGVAEIVGRLLRQLGEERQALCVTHLPQVAAQGHHHLRVDKGAGEAGVATRVEALAGDLRVGEVARMLGGVEITRQSLQHAREMVASGAG